jgi:Domain of unknown function (DUF4349)
MTSTINEERLRLALHVAVDNVQPSDGASQRILEAARARHTDSDDGESVEEIDAAPPRHSRRRLVPLTAAAAVLLASAVVVSVATLGSTGHGAPAGGSAVSAQGTPDSGYRASAGLPSSELGTLQSGVADNSGTVAQGNQPFFGLATTSSKASSALSGTTGTLSPKVVAVGTVAMKVASSHLQTVLGQLTVLAIHDGGYVASSKVVAGSSGESSTATIVLRVPEHRFDSLVTVVQHYGTPTSVVTNSTDVTAQYVDYQAHIRALEASRTQYLAILAKAGSIASILEVQQQINVLQTQIDELEGQRNVLVNEATYSMLTVSLNPGQGATGASPSGLSTAWHDSIGGFVTGFESLVRAAGPALFAVLCLLVLFVLGRLSWRAARRRMI